MTDTITYDALRKSVKSTTKHAVSKATALVEMEWCKLSSLQEDIDFMRDELKSMHALLAKLGTTGDEDNDGDLDVQVREWRDEVRRLSADIEVCVDDYEGHVEEGGSGRRRGGNAVAAFFSRNTRRVASVGARHTISNRIKKLKARINEVSERRCRYNLDG